MGGRPHLSNKPSIQIQHYLWQLPRNPLVSTTQKGEQSSGLTPHSPNPGGGDQHTHLALGALQEHPEHPRCKQHMSTLQSPPSAWDRLAGRAFCQTRAWVSYSPAAGLMSITYCAEQNWFSPTCQ